MSSADLGVVQAYLKELRLPAVAKLLPETLRDAETQGRSVRVSGSGVKVRKALSPL
jgi:hypothetical protein